MAIEVPRQLLVRDPHLDQRAVVRVSTTSASQTPEQAGLTVEQPDLDSSTLVGDIVPVLSGDVEREESGELYVAQSGTDGNARWSFSRSGDGANDFRFRQRPGVCGQRPDVLAYDSAPTEWPARPRVRITSANELLLIYPVHDARFYELSVSTGWSTSWRYSQLDPSTNTWSNPASADGLGDWGFVGSTITDGPYWSSFDFVVYPDTGEVVAVVVGGCIIGGVVEAIGAVYSSVDDGANWVMRSRILTTGPNPTIEPDGDEFIACTAELTLTGRLVVLAATDAGVYSLVSDDRGKTFATDVIVDNLDVAYRSTDTVPEVGANRQTLCMRRMRNGSLLCYHRINAEHISSGDPARGNFILTVDGVSWTVVEHDTDLYYTMPDVAVVERESAFPWVYATVHDRFSPSYSGGSPAPVQFDELIQVAITARDPAPNLTIDDLCPGNGATNVHAIHLLVDAGQNGAARNNAPAGLFTTIDTPAAPTFDGFAEVAAVRFRGQIVLVATSLNDVEAETAVVVYRLDYMQAMQERMEPASDAFAAALFSRVFAGYFRTWEPYGLPSNWGFTRVTTGGGAAISAPNAEGGYFSSSAAGVQNYWTDTTLPYSSSSFTAVVRCVFSMISGGSTTSPECGLLLSLTDGGGNFAGGFLKFEVSGSDVVAQLADVHAGDLGAAATLTGARDEWIEVILSQWELTAGGGTVEVAAYWRLYDRDDDPDWLCGFELLGKSTLSLAGSSTERLTFGHIAANSTASARWKCVNLWRDDGTSTTTTEFTPIAFRSAPFVDEESESVRIARGEFGVNNDAGTFNFMRPAQMVSSPAQFVTDGILAEWRGEALAAGSIEYGTRYVYGGVHLFDSSPVQREWRSAADQAAIEIVLDAELVMGTGGVWDFDAIGIVGKNWPAFRFELHSADSWAAPDLSLRAALPGMTAPPSIDRTIHLFDATSATSSIEVLDHRCRVITPTAALRGDQTWRPHRFASKEPGPKFYAVFVDEPAEGRVAIFEIVDNNRDTLRLKTDPLGYGVSASPDRVAIISDRVAWDMRTRIRADYPTGIERRFCRILIESAESADDGFMRAGAIYLGTATDFGPGIEWGYTVATGPSGTIIAAQSGASYRRRQHTGIRVWTVGQPPRLPALESAVSADFDTHQSTPSWQRVVDVTARLEADGEPALLIFDGNAAASGASPTGEQLLADPYDLAVVRLSTGGDQQHIGYWGRTRQSVGGGSECRPSPIVAVRRIIMTEVL